MQKTLFSTLVAGALAAGSMGSASALTFNYISGGGFVDGTDAGFPIPAYSGYKSPLDARNSDADPNNDVYSTLNWGIDIGNGQSGGVINQVPPFSTHPGTGQDLSGSIVVGGAPIDFGYVVHHNEEIGSIFGPATVTVSYNLWLDDGGPAGNVYKWHGDFVFSFKETVNTAPCSDGNPKGTICDDFFSYEADMSNFDPTSFTYGGNNYNITLTGFWDAPVPGGVLTDPFYSPENLEHVPAYVRASIPEPASMALMGLGLAALGVATRRRKQTLNA